MIEASVSQAGAQVHGCRRWGAQPAHAQQRQGDARRASAGAPETGV